MITIACQKQSSPKIASEETRTQREIERLDACSKVNFNKGVFLYKNMLDLFVCTKWDEEFPHLFNSLKTISAESWDHMLAPIDLAFVENHSRRDKIFRNIRELDALGGLDDLSYVIVALNETNFFDSTKALFACVDNSLDPQCLSRVGRIPQKKSLKNIIRLVDTNPDSIENLSSFIKKLVVALDGKQEILRTEINKVRSSPLYIPARLSVLDSLASKVVTGFSEEDRDFLAKILLTKNPNEDVSWIYQWVQDVKMNRDIFRDLLEYPILTNPEFVGEIKKLEKIYDNGLSCSIKSTQSPNELIEFVFRDHLSDYVSVIRNKNYKSFFDFTSMGITGLKASTEVCHELESNKYNLNFLKVLTHLAEFLREKKYYELVKFLATQSTATADPTKSFAENLYLPGLISGNLFSSFNSLSANVVSSTRDFYPIIFDVIKKLPPESYNALGAFAQDVVRVENDAKFKGVADFWNFFTSVEKNFIFNFLDRHFDNKVKFVMLFDFYTKFLDDLTEVQPIFKDHWMGTESKEEMSYLALQDLFTHLAGKETLLDFKKFFSRNQILKVLEVISKGQEINRLAQEELQYIYSDIYLAQTKSERYVLKIKYNSDLDSGYNASAVVECMQKFSDIQNGFYELVRHLPEACTRITNENIAYRMYGWLNAVEESYLSFKRSNDLKDSLLDQKGILSPYMLNSALGLSKILDNLLGPLGGTLPTKNGINYLLTSTHDHLVTKAAATLVEKNLLWMSSFFDVMPIVNIQHRNVLLKTVTSVDNFSYTKNFFNNVGILLMDYGQWVKSGEHLKAETRTVGKYDPKYDCEKVINQFITPYPCPGRAKIKEYGDDIIYLLQNVFEEKNGSPLAMILKAAKTGEGIKIPLNGEVTKKYRLTLEETFRFMYDTSDKSFGINNVEVKFVNEKDKTSKEKVTTLERIESVIREVRFDNNYLGVAYLNAVVHGDDYNKDVLERKKLLKKCVKIPGIRCSRKMSDSDLRMALNSLEVYDALLDANNGRALDARLNYGNYLKTFLQTLVASSATEAQKVQLLPLKDEALVKHNGKILSDLTVTTGFSNGARVIRDRIGRTRADFESFVRSEEFKRVDRALLYGFDLPSASIAAESLFRKLKVIPTNEKQNFLGHTVDWLADLSSRSYEDLRLVEDTMARLVVVGSFLGPPDVVFGKTNLNSSDSKYANNNLFQMFLALEKIIDYWPTLKNYLPGDIALIDAFKPLNTALYFLTNKLKSSTDPQKNIAYLVINDLFLALQTTLFDKMPNPRFPDRQDLSTQGLSLVLGTLKNPLLVKDAYKLIQADYRYLGDLHLNSGDWFSTFGLNIKRMTQSSKLDLTPVRDYLSFTSQDTVRQTGDSEGAANYHYDELSSLIKFLGQKSNSGQSNFILLKQKVFVENYDQISQMIDYLIPAIAIKEVKPPLYFN